MPSPRLSPAFRRGLLAGCTAGTALVVAAFPPRIAVGMGMWGTLLGKVERVVAGTMIDLGAVIWLLAPVIALLTLLPPLVLKPLRRGRWQQLAALFIALPIGSSLYLLSTVSQEVKSERGAFPTMFDFAAAANAAFLEGQLGFIGYNRIWIPLGLGLLALAVLTVVVVRRARRTSTVEPWQPWALGVTLSLAAFVAVLMGIAAVQSTSNRFTAAALGDPFTGILESSIDLAMSRGPAGTRDLVLAAELPKSSSTVGAARLGWPGRNPSTDPASCWPHPHARALDVSAEPPFADPRGRALIDAFEQISTLLFEGGDSKVAFFQLSLESFRGDDVHALNPRAPREIDPYTTGLYEQAGTKGTLASKRMVQAGVRTAQALGALTCGLGTLPYNLSLIRDLLPFPVRCTSDVLADAGFRGSFFYASDPTFDNMAPFLGLHGYPTVIAQDELPPGLPKGAWDATTDFGVFDEATKRAAAGFAKDASPQMSLVMSLSNHSPFPAPEDLPPEVTARVDAALKNHVNRADSDDRRRLLTHAYTDTALQRFFGNLEKDGLAERSVVMVIADHSTGQGYIWGASGAEAESDEAKSVVPFLVIIPEAFLARVVNRPALEAALAKAQGLIDEAPLSQNDVPRLMLALMNAHPGVVALPSSKRWHTLGGQVTSPYFQAGGDEPGSYVLGINGVSELFALDRQGVRVGPYEDSVFLKTRADRYRVTPRLIPITATLIETINAPEACTKPH